VNVTTDIEFQAACSDFLLANDDMKSLRFVAISKTQAAFQENVADPILKAIEKLVESLNLAMEKVKSEQWAQRAQEKATSTGVVLSEVYQSAAQEARVSFEQAKKTLNEIQFEQIMKETAEGIKFAAEGISSYAQDLVEELKKKERLSSPCSRRSF